ncbi:hypothetical protein NBZ79_01280 [Sneathiella marina]|uniref:Glutamine amidotransferase type-2 domain-containing protein n=1 Tax=Sneathiella marina TaxID=2950108 RepID=A0ABY4W3H9_9PROT|nr:hypothetical protein [Sneathiella marina]USG61608.1 hypothetical protein NBZ79_01280 [Sneathiella marina]
MCGLCGLLGIDHWTETSANAEVFSGDIERSIRHERAHRVLLLNKALAPVRMKARDFQASSYIISSSTGRSEIVHDIQALWLAVEKMGSKPVDPLSAEYLDQLSKGQP